MRSNNANLAAVFLDIVRERARRPFLIDRDGRNSLDYAQLDEATGRLATRLRELGAAPGDRIVVQVEKSPEAVLLYLASLRAGLVFVPLNTAYTAAEVDFFIRDADPAVVVCRPQMQAQVEHILVDFHRCAVVTLAE